MEVSSGLYSAGAVVVNTPVVFFHAQPLLAWSEKIPYAFASLKVLAVVFG